MHIRGRAAQWGAVTSGLVTAILSLFVWTAFQEGTAGLQLVERFTWIGSFGIDYFLGLDGLNLFFSGNSLVAAPDFTSLLEYAGTSLAVQPSPTFATVRCVGMLCGTRCNSVLRFL